MVRYVFVSVGSGFLFGLMDGLINANPLAQRLYRAFEPIAKNSINVPAGIARSESSSDAAISSTRAGCAYEIATALRASQ